MQQLITAREKKNTHGVDFAVINGSGKHTFGSVRISPSLYHFGNSSFFASSFDYYSFNDKEKRKISEDFNRSNEVLKLIKDNRNQNL